MCSLRSLLRKGMRRFGIWNATLRDERSPQKKKKKKDRVLPRRVGTVYFAKVDGRSKAGAATETCQKIVGAALSLRRLEVKLARRLGAKKASAD